MPQRGNPTKVRSRANKILLAGMKKDVWTARLCVLLVAVGLLAGSMLPFVKRAQQDEHYRGTALEEQVAAIPWVTTEVLVGMSANIILAGIMLGLFSRAKHRPVGALAAALVLYVVLQLVSLTLNYRAVLVSPVVLVGPALMTLLLLYGVRAARRYAAAAAKQEAQAAEQPPE